MEDFMFQIPWYFWAALSSYMGVSAAWRLLTWRMNKELLQLQTRKAQLELEARVRSEKVTQWQLEESIRLQLKALKS